MPAPSPIRRSAPTAPRWFRFSRIFSPWATIACDLCPPIWATKPTPQASCSWEGLYRPASEARSISLRGATGPLSISSTAYPDSALEDEEYRSAANIDAGAPSSIGSAGDPGTPVDGHELDLARDLALDRGAAGKSRGKTRAGEGIERRLLEHTFGRRSDH